MSTNRYLRELGDRARAVRLAIGGRTHQYPEVQALRKFLSAFAIDGLIDVGANLGQYATMLRKDVGYKGHIFSFEPNPEAFAHLQKAARGDGKWHIFNMALSDNDGTVPFNIMAAHQFSSIAKPAEQLDAIFTDRNKVAKVVDVPCRRLETLAGELFAPYGISRPFLKMDTQGHDRAVCDGAGAVLRQMLGVQTELAVRPQYASATEYRDMIGFLEGQGFVPSAMFANNKGHFPVLVEMDGIFIRADLAGEGATGV